MTPRTPERTESPDLALSAALRAILPRFMREVRRTVEELDGEDSLTLPQFFCLEAIGARGTALTTQLARLMQVAVPTMTNRLDGLVERGLVRREPDPLSRRQVRVVMTPAGDESLRRYRASLDSRLGAIVGSLPPEARARLLAALDDLAGALPESLPAAGDCTPPGDLTG